MGKHITAAALIGLMIVMTLVSALDGVMTGGNNKPYTVEVSVEKGWNIIAGTMPNEAITPDSEIKVFNIKAVWYYAPDLKKYIQIHPNFDMSVQLDDDVVLTSAMWVYSDKAGRLKYSTLEDYAPLDSRQLIAGYNFVTITPDMYHGTLDGASYDSEYFIWNKIKGNCNLESIHAWNPETQEWTSVDADMNFGEEINDLIGMGMVVKVSNNCKLNKPAEEINQPPELPDDSQGNTHQQLVCTDSDGGLNYYSKGTVTGYNEDAPIKEISSVSDSCSGNTLHEWICKDLGEYDDESYICPNGCSNGACI